MFELPAWPPQWPEIAAAIETVIASGDWGRYHTSLCRDLQSALRDQFAVAACQLTCSGTAAIELALRAARVGPGDEVIIAAYDYPGNFRTIELLGATPVLVDVAADSPCMDATQLAAVASPRVVAVIASHLYGQAAPIEAIRSRCQDHGWLLIEDACQVPGMRIGQRPAGSFGDLAALSFGGSKPITCGTGGALLISNELLAARLTAIVDRPSDTYPLSPLQAATIGPQLDRLSEMNRIRAATARFLIDARPDLQWIDGNDPHVTPAYYKLAWQSTLPHAHPSLPIGSGFRAAAQISPRRCRKPVPLDRSLELAHRCRLLDHRALLIDAADHQKLADALPR